MGNQTVVMILNDAFHVIEEHPDEFIKGIKYHMHEGGSFPVSNHCNPATVIRTGHADEFRLYATFQNSIIDLGDSWRNDPGSLVQRMQDNEYLREHVRTCVDMAKRELETMEKALDAIDASG